MKLSIQNISTSIAATIEAIAQESDTIASGVIGSSFSTSGPGYGWSKQHDVNDFAKRALDDGYGAASYIDSEDGREATLEEGEVVWSEESVVEIELPTVEQALGDMDTWEIIRREAASYGVNLVLIDALAEKIDSASQA